MDLWSGIRYSKVKGITGNPVKPPYRYVEENKTWVKSMLLCFNHLFQTVSTSYFKHSVNKLFQTN